MAISDFAKNYHEKMFLGWIPELLEKDPEFVEIFANFAFDEVIHMPDVGGKEVDGRLRHMAILASLVGSQSIDGFYDMLYAAMNFGVTPVELKELLYQATPYLGMGRVFPFLEIANDFLEAKGVELPLESQKQIKDKMRYEDGKNMQLRIFGKEMETFEEDAPEGCEHIHKWIISNCFGDYYTREGLDIPEREMITFCFLLAQGGCERQMISHTMANIRCGNDRLFLFKIISQCLPFIGYPRCINAIDCVDEAIALMEDAGGKEA